MLFFRRGGSGGSGKRMLLSSLSVGIWWMGVFVVVAGRAGDSWDAWMFGSLLRVSPDVRVGSVETAELLAGISVSMKGIMCGRFGGSLVPYCGLSWGTASFACLEFRVAGKWATERSVFVCDFCRVGAVFECVSAWLSPSFVTGSAQDGFSYRYYFPSSIARNSP